jgi:hypothetical protein
MEVKMSLKLITLITIAAMLVAGCGVLLPETEQPSQAGDSTEPTQSSSGQTFPGSSQKSPLDPVENEDNMTRSQVLIDSSEVLQLESQPLQIVLHLKGSLPTPCHQLRAKLSEPDAENRINVEIYSLANPDTVCIQVLQAFESNIPLGSYAAGAYTVLVNGEKVGEFTQ